MFHLRRLLLAVAAGAAIAAAIAVTIARPATAAPAPDAGSPVRHVVIVGVPGLRWSQVTPAAAPAGWSLAEHGSVGSVVPDTADADGAACPADGWLTLNAGARAAAPGRGGDCPALPAVVQDGSAARIPAMPGLIAGNARFHENPDWGVLGRLAACSTAVGPGAALALAAPEGTVGGYVPSAAGITAGLLARCPLTVVDLEQKTTATTERTLPTAIDHAVSHVMEKIPPDTLVVLTAPGQAGGTGRTPHLLTTVVSGPGYGRGLLRAASTRQPGIVTLTDLTPSVARWLGATAGGYLTGSAITRGDRGSLSGTVAALTARDTAEQVWLSTRTWFFTAYAALDALLFGVPALVFRWNRRRRAACWTIAGVIAAAVPAGTFAAGLAPWSAQSHPAVWLYGLSAGWTAVLAGLALAAARWRGLFASFGVICLVTLAVLGLDVMTGSRLQLETPFGLSLLTSGRYYGISNNGIGVYCAAALVAAAWAGTLPRRRAAAAAGAVGLFAVAASGWPGFGAKVGGTIALVPCLVLLLLALAGVHLRWRYAAVAALSGLTLVAVFAAVTYLVPAAGTSDIGAFFGSLLHGQGGAVLERKAGSNLGSLTASPLSPLVPLGMILAGLVLWRSPAKRRWPPLLRITVWLVWLVLVIGWIADDSGVIVPATAAPFALPLVLGMCASASDAGPATSYCCSAFDGSSVAGQPVTLRYVWNRQALLQYQLSRLTAGQVLRALALGRIKVTGLEYVPETGPAILASNHLSVVDSFYLPLVISRPVVFPAKAEYFAPRNLAGKLFAQYLKSTNQLPLERGAGRSAFATLDSAVDILRRGDLFGFYPEGGRSPDGRLYRGRTGIGYLALESGAPVLPVAMEGTGKMLPLGARVPRPTPIGVRIGKPIEFPDLVDERPGKARRLVAEQVIAAIGELSGQEYVHEYSSDVRARLSAE